MSIRVRAIRKGVYGVIRDVDAEFEIENEEQLGSWMVRLDGKPNPKADLVVEFDPRTVANAGQPQPSTLSQAQEQPSHTAAQALREQREGGGKPAGDPHPPAAKPGAGNDVI